MTTLRRKLRVAVWCANPVDQCSLYRGLGPWYRLAQDYPNLIDLFELPSNELHWTHLASLDALVCQRPWDTAHLTMVKWAKLGGIPVIMDYDDDLFRFPLDNQGCAEIYNNPRARLTIQEILKYASAVTLSTPGLVDVYKGFVYEDVPLHVIPNCHDPKMFPYMNPLENGREQEHRLIAWRGSPTHTADVIHVAIALLNFMLKEKSAVMKFYGQMPWFLDDSRLNGRVKYVTKAMPEFNASLWEERPAIMLVPLIDHQFNRCKSNIAWIEGTRVGAATAATRLPEFIRPGIRNFNPVGTWVPQKEVIEEWETGLSEMYNQPDQLNESMRLSWDFIQKNLILQDWNRDRLRILSDVVGKDLVV